MRSIYNIAKLRERRRQLRNNATEAENLLWKFLKKNGLSVKFVRQYGVGGYILDFYCPKKRLAVELDGVHHKEKENVLNDIVRTRFLETQDIKVIRFDNREVFANIECVCDRIKVFVGEHP